MADARKHPRLRRWMWRIGVFVIGTLLLIFIIIQVILFTGLPQSIMVGQVEKALGLRMSAQSVSTGWLGHTQLRDVKLALPLSQADQSFLTIPQMRVDHTNLAALLLGWGITVKRVELQKPVLYVHQNASGQWNMQEIGELLARAGGKKTGEQTAQAGIPLLPRLQIDGLTIDIHDNRQHELKVLPINVNGEPDTPLTWKYDVEVPSGQQNVPPRLSILGKVAPGGSWQHEARVWVHDIGDWVRAWKPSFDSPVTLDANWSGQFTSDGIDGFLRISDSQLGSYHASGALRAARAGDQYSISPANLRLQTPVTSLSELLLPRGRIDYDGKIFRITRLQLGLLNGPAELSGWFEPDINQGAIEAFWQDLKLRNSSVVQSGKINLTYLNPPAANLGIAVTLSSSGTAPDGPFEAVMKLSLSGRSLNALTWRLEAPQLAWHRPQPLILDGLSAAGTYRQDAQHKVLAFNTVSLPTDNRLSGRGSYDLVSKEAKLHLDGQDWPVHLVEGTRLAFGLDLDGQGVPDRTDPKKTDAMIHLTQFFLRSGNSGLTLSGNYDGRQPKPVTAEVTFENRPITTVKVTQPLLIQGFVRAHATLQGTLYEPLNVAIDGSLDGRDAVIFNHVIGDVHTAVHGSIDYEKAFIRADGIPFLDGIWNLGATYVTHQNDRPVYATTIDIGIDHLPLPRLSEFLGARRVDGVFDGKWDVYYPRLKPDPQKIILTGSGSIKNLVAGAFVADSAEFTTTLRDGIFKVDGIKMTRGSYGRIDASGSVALNNPRQLWAGVQFTQFPIDVTPQLNFQLNGGTNVIQILLPDANAKEPANQKLRVNTDLTIRSSVSVNQQPQGEVRVLASMNGRVVDLREIQGDILGGKISGDAIADIDDFNKARASLWWNDLKSERIVRMYPELNGFGGTFSGNARLAPATVQRPLAPLALDVYQHSTGGHWRSVKLGDSQLHAFVDPYTNQFIASNIAPNSLQIAGGTLNAWYSGTRHIDTSPAPNGVSVKTGETISNLLSVKLDDIDIDQIVKAFIPSHTPGFGKLSGQLYTLSAPKTRQLLEIANETTDVRPSAAAPTTSPANTPQQTMLQHILATTTADGTVAIDNSDLGNYGPIADLYNLMHLGADIRKPTGHGSVAFRMEQGRLNISNVYYYNRGIEVRAVATAPRMWQFPDNSIEGSAVGTARPLRSIKLPVFAEADVILSQLQGALTSVEFKGTVKNPRKDYIRPLNINRFGGELRSLLLAEVGANRNQ